jgi:hypothetical protein
MPAIGRGQCGRLFDTDYRACEPPGQGIGLKRLVLVAAALVAVAALAPAAAQAKQLGTTVEFEIRGEIDTIGNVTYHYGGIAQPEGFPNFGVDLFEDDVDFAFLDPSRSHKKKNPFKEAPFACASNRTVEIYRDEPESPDFVVGRAQTEFSLFFGRIELPASMVPGTYYAVVAEKVAKLKKDKRKARCLAATSPPVTVFPPQVRGDSP